MDEDNKQEEIKSEKNQLEPKEKKQEEDYMGLGICFGASIGGLIGWLCFDNFALGMCFGSCIGMLIGSSMKKKK